MQKGGALVNVGDTVKTGQLIGLSGNTGYSAFPHLHFETRGYDAAGNYKQLPTRFYTQKGIIYLRPGKFYRSFRSDKRFVHPAINKYLDFLKFFAMIFLYIFVGLIALLLIIAALLPKAYNVEKTIIISKPVPDVMNRISDLNYYSQWNPWQQSDPTAKNNITGTAKTPGHKYAWEGKKVGVGSLTLNNMDDKHIHFDLEFLKPFKSKAKDNWLFEQWGEGETKVTWQNSGEFPWPIASLMGPMIVKQLNQQFEQGLNNLKKMCEV